MARTFASASLQYLINASPPVTDVPLTMACWFNSTDLTLGQALINITDNSSTTNYFTMLAHGTLTGDPVTALTRGGGVNQTAMSSTGFSSGVWHHACAVYASSSSQAAYIDGGSKGTNSGTSNPTGIDDLNIGRAGDSTPGAYMEGKIAEAAIWNVALTDAEVASLGAGFSPLIVHPKNLIFYAPLIRDEDRDIIGGLALAPTAGPTIGTHVPIIYPPSPTYVPAETAASIVRWNDRGGLHLQTDANWGATAHYFQADLRATAGTIRARLVKVSNGDVVTDSEISTASSTLTRVRSAAITLADTEEYIAQTGWIPGTDEGFTKKALIIHF